jgi:hypothetical protein
MDSHELIAACLLDHGRNEATWGHNPKAGVFLPPSRALKIYLSDGNLLWY